MLRGKQTWWFDQRPVIIGAGTVVGPDEGEGPLASDFDLVHPELDHAAEELGEGGAAADGTGF